MIVAILAAPARPDALARAAALAGLALADWRRCLAGTLPRVLVTGLSPERAGALAAGLEAIGVAALALDPAATPGDQDRVVARALTLAPDALVATDAQGIEHRCPGAAIALFQRGTRVTRRTSETTTSERRLDAGRALLSGGLLLTRKVETTARKTVEAAEPFLLVQRGDGEPDVILYERRLDYRFLGAEMGASSRANLDRVAARLQTLAPHAPADDRVAEAAFVAGLPATPADPVDLALFLVTLARARGSLAGRAPSRKAKIPCDDLPDASSRGSGPQPLARRPEEIPHEEDEIARTCSDP